MELASWMVSAPLVLAISTWSLGPAAGDRPWDPPWDPPPCSAATTAPAGVGWYRLDPVLDGTGTLAARRLVVGVDGASQGSMDLAPESFASGPVSGLVLSGEDDGSVSRLRLVDAARGCAVAIGEAPDVIRSAVLAPGAGYLYEHRVDRATRVDLGIWRREIGGDVRRVLAGLAPDPVLGPTFVTDLVLEPDGRLLVSSCAQPACRVRLLDPEDGTVTMVKPSGPALGVTGGSLVARAACFGDPCPVDAIDLASGQRRRLATEAYAAALGGPGRGTLLIETAGHRVAAIDVRSGRRTAEAASAGVPLRAGSTAPAGAEGAAGTVVLAPGGRPAAHTLVPLEPVSLRPPARPEVTR